jgi:polyhydroxybutyrate depolymerase
MALCTACRDVDKVNTQQAIAAGWHDGTMQQAKVTRYFRYYVPNNMPNNAPVVILFHGGSQSMRKIFGPNAGGTQAWQPLAESEKILLVVPNGTNPRTGDARGNNQNWNDCRKPVVGTRTNTTADDVGFTRQLIAWASANYQIDRTRVYATGASNGGEMSYRLGIELSDKVAAIAAFIANIPVDGECKPAIQPVPIMIANGTADTWMPWAGGDVIWHGGKVLSARQTLEYWLNINRSDRRSAQNLRLPDIDRSDNSSITSTFYPTTATGADVLFYRVEGGGHTMPSIQYKVPRFIQRRLVGQQNHDLEGARAAWSFLSRQRLSQSKGTKS